VCASSWHLVSAPSMPPRSPPFPEPALVTKKVVPGDCAGCAWALVARDAVAAAAHKIIVGLIVGSSHGYEAVSSWLRASRKAALCRHGLKQPYHESAALLAAG